MNAEDQLTIENYTWEPLRHAFEEWLNNRQDILQPGLVPEPTIKVLIFLALLDCGKACTYDDLREIFRHKNVIKGNVPDNTLRTSVLSLGKTLEKFSHPLELKSSRGRFELIPRACKLELTTQNNICQDPVVLLLEPVIRAEDVALTLIEKALLSLPGLYFLEWSARWWETYSSKEAEIRVDYEAAAWERLGIRDRLCISQQVNQLIGIVGLAPAEGLAEIGLLKKILREDDKKQIHYLAIDASPRLLRDHIGLLKETFMPEIENGRLICAGIVADIFNDLRDAIEQVRHEFKKNKIIKSEFEFLPSLCSMLVTYFGNCLGNNHQDQETDFFSMVHSVFQNRPLEILVGVSVMRSMPDQYIRNWDDFLLQSPRHLLETKKLLKSSQSITNLEPEFTLSQEGSKNDRCPPVMPEKYIVRHQIEGHIYRFYYKLAYDLELVNNPQQVIRSLPKGTLILLHSIIKYNMHTLVNGIKKCGLFDVMYDENYHQVVDTPNGKREYAVFSAYLEK